MENTQIDPRIINGESDFIRNFFTDLKDSKDYSRLKNLPYSGGNSRLQLFNYLDMEVIEKYLRKLQTSDLTFVNTFMSNGLEWVNGMAEFYAEGVGDADGRELSHLYVNLLALLAGAPTVFMKIGALTMYSIAPDTISNWVA